MQKITLDAAPRRPWKNGGGVTRELAIAPAGAGLDDFDWRISCAQVASGGAFSPFPGVDRSLALLEGAGLRLDFGGGETHTLTVDSAPLVFGGDQPVSAALLDGPVGDFNVMTRRARWHHRLQVLALHGRHALRRDAELELFYCTAGRLAGWLADARPFALVAGEGLLFDAVADASAEDGDLLLFEARPPVRLLRVQLWRR